MKHCSLLLGLALSMGALGSSCVAPGGVFVADSGNTTTAPRSSDDDASELEWKLKVSERELQLEELDAERKIMSAESDVDGAKFKVEQARLALVHFAGPESEQQLTQAAIGLQSSANRLQEATDELAEIKAMYAADDFAKSAEELVVARSERNLGLAQERYGAQKAAYEHLQNGTLPKKRGALERALHDAEVGMRKAEMGLVHTRRSVQLSLDKKVHALEKLREKHAKQTEDSDSDDDSSASTES